MGQIHGPSESYSANIRVCVLKAGKFADCHDKAKDGKLPTLYQPGKKTHSLHDRYYLERCLHDLRAVEDRLGHDREGGCELIPEVVVKHYSPQSPNG